MLFKTSWWRPLKGDPMGWLLDYDQPAVRYQALTDILERQPDVPAVREARAGLASDAVITGLLARQLPDQGWGSPADPATAALAATGDHLVLLAELGAPGRDERIATAADWALDQARTPNGDTVLPGALLWALLKFGYVEDARVRRAVHLAAKSLVARGAPDAPVRRTAWDGLLALWALLQLPASERNRGIEAAIQTALADWDHLDWTTLEPARLQFSFPYLGAPDLLFALRVLAEAGRLTDARYQPALDALVAQQNEAGRWPLTHNHSDRLLVVAESVGAESKWSTLNALRVLKATEPT